MKLTICEQWTQEVSEPTEKWFLDYVLRSPKNAGIHLTAGWCAYSSLQPASFSSVVEYFGGMGSQTMMIESMFMPDLHRVLDNSAEAVSHIKRQRGHRAYVVQADSYDPRWGAPADLVGLDFGDLTAWRTRTGEKHRALLDRVFAGEPRGVVITDVACRYLHLQRSRYETLLGQGTCETYEGYLDALSARLSALYGYTMVGGFYHRWSTVMAFAPAGWGVHSAGFIPTPASPVGLTVSL